jgi:hypothetical protein
MSIPKKGEIPSWIDQNLPEELVGSSLFVFKVSLRVKDRQTGKPKVIKIDMLPDLLCEREMIESQMEDIPAQYAFWAALYSELRMNVAVMERAVKVQKGQTIELIQRKAKDEGIKFTADQVRSVMEADPKLGKIDEALAKVQMQTGKVYHMLEALKFKAEISRSLLATKRQEYDKSS